MYVSILITITTFITMIDINYPCYVDACYYLCYLAHYQVHVHYFARVSVYSPTVSKSIYATVIRHVCPAKQLYRYQ